MKSNNPKASLLQEHLEPNHNSIQAGQPLSELLVKLVMWRSLRYPGVEILAVRDSAEGDLSRFQSNHTVREKEENARRQQSE